ncbi:MAG TPA: hypothetical protein EYP85_07835, partial [Armatimonadetes bacterium]|nr:hypothetical protein [Armatimonadota bacterium]
MIRKSLSADNLRAFLEAVRQTGRCLIAPVREGDLVLFREVPSAEEVLLDYGNTQWPCKEFLFPKTEPILHYRVQGGGKVELAEPELPAQGQVIFGVRPCDAAGLLVLDAVFRWDSEDAFYLHRRERTTIIGLACTEPRPECFCTAVGLSPTGTRGSDLLLTPLDGEFLAEAVTEKGEQLLREHEGFFQDTDLAKEEVTRTVE